MGEPILIEHFAEDSTSCNHHTPQIYGLQSYISVPIRRGNGEFFGTLCAIDPNPAKLKTPEIIGMFTLFADLIGLHLDAHDRLATSEAALVGERQASEIREQFIAVLGHDLRNPLASIDAGARLLHKEASLSAKGMEIVALLQSSVHRMAGLIDNVLDFARGRLGGGLPISRNADEPLGPVLEQVVAELRSAWPDRTIDARIDMQGPVSCDRGRIGQLLSNLLGNALTHGAPDHPVTVRALTKAGQFELSVANSGTPIPPHTLNRLFQPFFRASGRDKHQGLGLGLYIASEIARAHGGRLDVTSTEGETRFTLAMPAR